MGALLSLIMGKFKRDARVVMVGLDAAGKTTILYKLKVGEVVTTIPTIGFNVETVEYKNVKFQVWDIGGQDRIRRLWRHYYTGTTGIVFVVDVSDRSRIDLAKAELQDVLSADEMSGVPLLVYANKQDLPGAISTSGLVEALGLHSVRDRRWHVQPTTAITGEGLYVGLDWLADASAERK